MNHQRRQLLASWGDAGFTLVELMVVVLIIGVLVAIAIPVFTAITEQARARTCFANQRTILGAVSMWRVDATAPVSALEGVVDSSNPLMNPLYMLVPPRCPSAPKPVDRFNPTSAEGGYSVDATGNVLPCTFGNPAHGGLY